MKLDTNSRQDWTNVKLGEICEKAAKIKRKEVIPDEEFIYLDISGIDNQSNRIVDYKKYHWNDAPSRAQQIVKVGDTLFSTVRTYLRNIAMVDNSKYENQICSSGFTVIRAINGLADSKFLFAISLSEGFLQPLNKLQTGTSYPAVRDDDVFSQFIPLPPLPEQRAIVAKIEQLFSDLDNGIANLKKAQEQLKIYRQAVLKKAFVGELTRKWREEQTDLPSAEELLLQIKEEREKHYQKQLDEWKKAVKGWEDKGKAGKKPSRPKKPKELPPLSEGELKELPELPEVWFWKKIGNICECIVPNRDKPKSFTGNVKWITTPDLQIDSIRRNYSNVEKGLSEMEIKKYNAKVIPLGSVIMTCVGKFGISSIVEKRIVVNQQLHAFLPVNFCYNKYLAYCIQYNKVFF